MVGEQTFYLNDEQATKRLGEALAALIKAPCVLFLQGEIGTGKTALVRGLINALGYRGLVKSPTYTLVESYVLTCGTLYHFDLYRMAHPEELDFIGARDYFDECAIFIVEWPAQGGGYLPAADLILTLGYLPDSEGRQITLATGSSKGEQMATGLHSFHAQSE